MGSGDEGTSEYEGRMPVRGDDESPWLTISQPLGEAKG